MSERDFAAEMRAVVDAETSHGAYVARAAARDVVEKLTINDPELLNGWLHEQAEKLIWQLINDRDRSRRGAARTQGRSVFAELIEASKDGDTSGLGRYLQAPYVIEDGSRKPLAELMKDDLIYVADQYEHRAKSNAFEAAFIRAIARKVGKGTVADHFTESKLMELRESLKL